MLVIQTHPPIIFAQPFVDPENNTLGILLAYAVAFFFLGAILIKVDAAGESKRDQLVFEVILMLVMFTGPSLILLKAIYDEVKSSGTRPAPFSLNMGRLVFLIFFF